MAECLIGKLGVGDRDLAQESARIRIGRWAIGHDALSQKPIDEHIDATEKEACDRGDALDRPTGFEPPFERSQVGLSHRFIARDREQQRDVDVDAFEQQLLDGRNACRSAGYLDEQVGPVNQCP